MKIPKNHFSEYFKRSVVYLIKTKLAVFIISIIEFVDLCTNMVDLTYQIFFYGKEYDYKKVKYYYQLVHINIFSILYQMMKVIHILQRTIYL